MSFLYSYLKKKTLELAGKIKWLGIALSCFFSFFASASGDFSLENCSDLKRQDGFSITFTVPNPNPVTVTLSSNKLPVILWSSVVAAAIQDNDVTPGQRVLLTYTPTSSHGKSGTLSYKLDSGVGFKDKSSAAITVEGGNGTLTISGDNSEVSCADGDVTPPPINTSPKFEFGTLSSSDCSVNSDGATVSCELDFYHAYTGETPLVFVMPTIDPSDSNFISKKTEYPSALRVYDVTKKNAKILQVIAPHRKASSTVNFVPAPMQDIDYFVIEPGVLELNNGSKIVAGSIDTKKSCSRLDGTAGSGANSCTQFDLISYSDYGLMNPFLDTPGVLVEIQTNNNKYLSGEPEWLTGAAVVEDDNEFELFLERSEVIVEGNVDAKEKVAFVAGLGQGYISSLKFWLGSATTKKTTKLSDKVVKPVTEGCLLYTPFNDVLFDEPPVLVATKNSRYGSDGGWLRRCDVTKKSVAFIVEEDMNGDSERGHKQEKASFFMFEKPSDIGICEGFGNKTPVQTWKRPAGHHYTINDGWLEINGSPQIIGALEEGDKRYVGFVDDYTFDRTNKACDGKKCSGLNDLLIEKEALENIPSGLPYSLNIPNTHNIDNLPITDSSGRNVYEYNSLRVEAGGVVTIDSGKYKFGSINLNGTGRLEVKEGASVTIYTNELSLNNNSYMGVPIKSWNGSKPVFASNTEFRVNILENNNNIVSINNSGTPRTTFSGLLYSEKKVDIGGNSRVYGAVSAKAINLSSSPIIQAATACLPSVDDYAITITPETDIALMCGDDVPVFTINTTNNDETESLSVTVEVDPNANRFNVTAEPGFGSGSYPNFTSNSSGVLKLKVTPKNTSNTSLSTNYNLSVTMDDDTSQSVKSQFKFVPFKFEVPDQTVIAGKDNDVTTTVLACSDTGKTKVETYSGTPSISYEVKKPDPTLAKKGVLTYAPVFTSGDKGAREDTLKISESGEFLVTLTDDKFDCTGLSGCPIDGGGKLTGSFTIKSRPWKIAICDVKASLAGGTTKNNPGATIEANGAFIPSGDLFNASLKPVVYSDSSGVDECTLATTFNYFTDTKGHSAPYVASFEVVYPSGEELANLEAPLIGEFASTDKNSTNDRMKTLELRWNEVGTLKMKSNAHYQSTSLVEDEESIGRFYPDYFNITQSTWTAPDKQGGSTYMGQPFQSVAFEVKANNIAGNETKNYGSFDEALKASFYLRGDKSDRVSILDSDLDSKNWTKDIGVWSRSWTDAKWNRIGSGTNTTTPDGPYNSDRSEDSLYTTSTILSLSLDGDGDGVSDYVDPTIFKYITTVSGLNTEVRSVDQKLLNQPDVRYGRMRLQDVGGNQGYSVRVPLSIEYWRAGSFVLNAKDSNSRFDTSNNMQCNHIEWSEITPAVSDAKLANTLNPVSDDGSVDRGESLSIYARQSTSRREQVRLFLRQGSTANPDGATCSWSTGIQPWLIYNWRNKGDEDPSAVVTFGINRGNDRIIFRNEPGLTN
ncbi:hypothetical protein DS893_17435 [Vibrionales bacterium C3R12]|nr:hypothetical protein DS893_17435 [Vibrionales bacterium C3R12]